MGLICFLLVCGVNRFQRGFEGEANDPNQEALQGGNCFLTTFSLFLFYFFI